LDANGFWAQKNNGEEGGEGEGKDSRGQKTKEEPACKKESEGRYAARRRERKLDLVREQIPILAEIVQTSQRTSKGTNPRRCGEMAGKWNGKGQRCQTCDSYDAEEGRTSSDTLRGGNGSL